MFKIIANKKVEITEDEYKLFTLISNSYAEYGGASLFHGLFEVNDEGIITLIKPPNKSFSFEIYFFTVNLMINQQLRSFEKKINEVVKTVNSKLDELDKRDL